MLCWIFLTLIWLEDSSVSRNVADSHLKLRWNSHQPQDPFGRTDAVGARELLEWAGARRPEVRPQGFAGAGEFGVAAPARLG